MMLTIKDLDAIIMLIDSISDQNEIIESKLYGPWWKHYKKTTQLKLFMQMHKLQDEAEKNRSK